MSGLAFFLFRILGDLSVKPALQQLLQELARNKHAAFADSTEQSYRRHWRVYIFFCGCLGLQPFPASPANLCIFATYVSSFCSAPQSISSYLSSLKSLHLLLDFDASGFLDYELRLTLRGIARLKLHIARQAAPITHHILLQFSAILDLQSAEDTTFWCLFLFAFFCMARKSNLVPDTYGGFDAEKQLSRGRVAVVQHGLEVSWSWSKTIQFGDREHVVPLIPIRNSILCPVTAFARMCLLTPAASTDPAFAFRTKTGILRPVLYAHLQAKLKRLIQAIKLDPADYSSHSFRRGGCTLAFSANVPSELIKRHGDWRSDCYQRYIDMGPEQRLSLSSRVRDHILAGNI